MLAQLFPKDGGYRCLRCGKPGAARKLKRRLAGVAQRDWPAGGIVTITRGR